MNDVIAISELTPSDSRLFIQNEQRKGDVISYYFF